MRARLAKCLNWARNQVRVPLSARLAKGSDVFELASLGCFVAAAFYWCVPAGLVVLGAALYYLSWVTHVSSTPRQ
jgi:hypothetical protein